MAVKRKSKDLGSHSPSPFSQLIKALPAGKVAPRKRAKRQSAENTEKLRRRHYEVFTKFPPADIEAVARGELELNATPAHLAEWELSAEITGFLPLILKAYGSEENKGLRAMDALCLAHELGYYPPRWACDHFAKAFSEWNAARGKISLDRVLGLRPGRGKDPAYKSDLISARNQMVLMDVKRFVSLKVSVSQAAALASLRMQHENWDQSGWNLGNLSAEAIEKLYYASGWARDDSYLPLKNWTNRDIAEWLAHFPEVDLPPALRRRLNVKSAD
jgi:hypothetical protein